MQAMVDYVEKPGAAIARQNPSAEDCTWILPLSRGFRVRPAADSDAPRIIRLIAEVWSECPGRVLRVQRELPELLTPARSYREWGGRFWVLEQLDEIVGTVAIKPALEPQVMELQKLCLHRLYRRQGLGAFLCELAEQESLLRQCHRIDAWSDTRQVEQHRLFERRGYVRDDTVDSSKKTDPAMYYCYHKQLKRKSN